jgi:hypothetical protein
MARAQGMAKNIGKSRENREEKPWNSYGKYDSYGDKLYQHGYLEMSRMV